MFLLDIQFKVDSSGSGRSDAQLDAVISVILTKVSHTRLLKNYIIQQPFNQW